MSAHGRSRSRLAALASDEAAHSALGANGWRRTYGRFTPGSPSYATLVYERGGEPQELVRMDVFEPRPTGSAFPVESVGWVALERFPSDPLLTTLPALVPGCKALLSELVARVAALHAAAPRSPPRPIHGAPHLPQWLDDGGALGLVDFDRHGLGDPELDVATLVASFEDDLGRPDLGGRVLEAYEDAAGPLRPGLVAAYRTQRRLAKALGAARSIRPDGDERARRRLELALSRLDEETE